MGAGGLSRKTGQGWPWVALFVIVQEASLCACKIVSFHIRAQGMRNALAGASLIAPPAPGGGLLLIGSERECNSGEGTFLIGQEDRQQCMSGPIITECARTARKRTIGALDFLRLSENLEENLDNKLLWATVPHETTEKGRISEENGESRFCMDLAVGEPITRRIFSLSSCLLLF